MDDLSKRLKESAPRPSRTLEFGAIQDRARRRARLLRALTGGAVLTVLVIVVGMLAMVGREDGREGLDVVGEPDHLAGVAVDSWVRLLARVPDTAEVADQPVVFYDLDRARRLAGIEPLSREASNAELARHLDEIFGTGNAPSAEQLAPGQGATADEVRAEPGFSLTQIDQVITAGQAPENLYVATGRFDPEEIAAALEADPTWGSRLEVTTYRGIEYYSWGVDGAIGADPTPVRPLGRGGRLVVGEGWLSWTYGDAQAKATIDASIDPARSLATIPWLRNAAEAADEAQLTQALAWGTTSSETFIRPPAFNPDFPPIEPPDGWSGGTATTPDSAVSMYVLVYASEEAAAANLDAFTDSWEQIDPERHVQVRRRGPVLEARLVAPSAAELPSITIETPEGRYPLNLANFTYMLNVNTATSSRPRLPDPAPTQDEILQDGVVSDSEYETAFWTFVQCAEDSGLQFTAISRRPNGRFHYSSRAGNTQREACYETHFMQVDMTWQIANE